MLKQQFIRRFRRNIDEFQFCAKLMAECFAWMTLTPRAASLKEPTLGPKPPVERA